MADVKEVPDKGEPKKKVHWTQTPKGRKKMAKVARKRHTAHKAAVRKTTAKLHKQTLKPAKAPHDASIPQDTVAYALGHIECWIETFAKSASVSAEALAAELGAILRGKNSG